jgi:hypothetical protein
MYIHQPAAVEQLWPSAINSPFGFQFQPDVSDACGAHHIFVGAVLHCYSPRQPELPAT